MQTVIKKRGHKKWRIVLVILVSVIGVLTLYNFFYPGPKQVNSGIYKLEKVFTAHSTSVWTVQFSRDGNLIASGSVDSTVKVWKKTGEIVHNLRHPCGVTYLDFSDDGNYIATSGYDAKVRVWSLSNDSVVKEFTGHTGTTWSVTFSPDGKTIASGGEDATIKLWDLEKGTLVKTLEGHKRTIWVIKYSPDGNKIASGSFDNKVKIWDAHNGNLLRTIDGHTEAVLCLAFTSDGQTLASGSDDETIRLWNMTDGKLLRTIKGKMKHVTGLAFSPDNKRLVSSCKDRDIIGEFFQNFFGASKSNKWVTVWLWDVATGNLLQTFSEHSDDASDVDYSPDGEWIVSASEDKTVDLWRLNR